jgi:hypothetical protein
VLCFPFIVLLHSRKLIIQHHTCEAKIKTPPSTILNSLAEVVRCIEGDFEGMHDVLVLLMDVEMVLDVIHVVFVLFEDIEDVLGVVEGEELGKDLDVLDSLHVVVGGVLFVLVVLIVDFVLVVGVVPFVLVVHVVEVVLVVEVLLVVLGGEDEEVVDVVVVVVVELVVLGGELEVLEVEVVEGGAEDDEVDELPPLHGCVDSKSVATYKSRVERPPQVSLELPVQGILQEVLSNGKVPLPRTTPQ